MQNMKVTATNPKALNSLKYGNMYKFWNGLLECYGSDLVNAKTKQTSVSRSLDAFKPKRFWVL